MIVYLLGLTEQNISDPLPPGPLGETETVPVDGSEGFAIMSVDVNSGLADVDVESVEWLGPRVLHHDDLMRSAMKANVVPIRFGTIFSDRSAALHAAQLQLAEIGSAFDRCRDRNEYRLTVRGRRSSATTSSSGIDYLQRRSRERAGSDELFDTCIAVATEASSGVRVRERSGESIDLVLLASEAQWDETTSLLLDLDVVVEFEGPLPPYEFARADV